MAQNIVIVGGGIIGAMAAYHLAKQGAQITVVDVGNARATDASFGWINSSFFADDAHFNLRTEGIAAYKRLAKTLDVPVTTKGASYGKAKGLFLIPNWPSSIGLALMYRSLAVKNSVHWNLLLGNRPNERCYSRQKAQLIAAHSLCCLWLRRLRLGHVC